MAVEWTFYSFINSLFLNSLICISIHLPTLSLIHSSIHPFIYPSIHPLSIYPHMKSSSQSLPIMSPFIYHLIYLTNIKCLLCARYCIWGTWDTLMNKMDKYPSPWKPYTHSFFHSFIHSFIHSSCPSNHSSTYPPINSYVSIHSSIYLSIHIFLANMIFIIRCTIISHL